MVSDVPQCCGHVAKLASGTGARPSSTAGSPVSAAVSSIAARTYPEHMG